MFAKFFSITTGLFLVVFLSCVSLIPNSAKAASDPICNFASQFEELSKIQNNQNLGDNQRLLDELRIRKSILGKIIDCSTQEILSLENNLSEINASDAEAKRLQKQFSEELGNSINYYQFQKSKINDLGLKGSKDLAKNILDWRQTGLKPLSENIMSFSAWAKNQNLFKTAEDRLMQINQTLRRVNLYNNEEVRSLITEAENNYESAKRDNQEAKLAIQGFNELEPLGLVKTSLESLNKTYENFFALSEIVKKIISGQ